MPHPIHVSRRALISLSTTTATVATLLLAPSTSWAASWETNVNYGGNGSPTMDLYVPDSVDDSPGIVVALHYCGGSAQNAHGWFQALSDEHGFIIIAGDSAGNCWDSSPGRSGEKAAVVQMVQYTIDEYGADASRVFAAGASSGACLTNALMASYPEVFAGGSVLAGVPAGAWPAGNTSCSGVCNATPPTRSAQEWGDVVRNTYAYDGPRPRLQLWHGSNDEYLYFPFLAEEEKQWTNVLGLDSSRTTMDSDTPSQGWERTSYLDENDVVQLEVNSKQGEVHDLTGKGLFPDVVRFFGLDMDNPTDTGTGGDANQGAGGSPGAGGGSGSGASSGSGGSQIGGSSGGAGSGATSSTTSTGGTTAGGVATGGAAPSSGTGDGSGIHGGETADGAADGGGGCQIGGRTTPPLGWFALILTTSLAWAARRRRPLTSR